MFSGWYGELGDDLVGESCDDVHVDEADDGDKESCNDVLFDFNAFNGVEQQDEEDAKGSAERDDCGVECCA